MYGGLHEIVNINMFIKRSGGMAVAVCVCDDACNLRFESATWHKMVTCIWKRKRRLGTMPYI